MNKANQLQRLLQVLIFSALLLCAGGCQLPRSAGHGESAEAFDYAQAVTYMIPELQRHCAFGSDLLQLQAAEGSTALLQAAADTLRRHGAAVSLAEDDEAFLAGSELAFTSGSRRRLQLAACTIGDTVLLSLMLDEVTLYCSFTAYHGQVRPASAVSVMRRAYGS